MGGMNNIKVTVIIFRLQD